MKRFLGVSSAPSGRLLLQVDDDPVRLLQLPGARTSAIFPAYGQSEHATPSGHLVAFVIPTSPRKLLAIIKNDFDPDFAERTYVSHGLASVVLFLRTRAEFEAVVDSDCVAGFELWPCDENGVVDVRTIESSEPSVQDPPAYSSAVSADALPHAAAVEVRQFNANLAFIEQRVAYFPELLDLVAWLTEAVSDMVAELRTLDASLDAGVVVRREHQLVSALVEVNSGITLLASQAFDSVMPLAESRFPVGEYSLLGIGGSVRAAWRLYAGLQHSFAEANLAQRVRESYATTVPFRPFVNRLALDYSEWKGASAQVSNLPVVAPEPGRLHIVYFSSRWGFHETLHTLSISWQSIHSQASKQWTLLTLTHEFLHSHVRELFSGFMDLSPAELEALSARCAIEDPANARESMAMALIGAMLAIDAVRGLYQLPGAPPAATEVAVSTHLDAEGVIGLADRHLWYVHELVVHVLDFLYVYDGRDDVYIASIWNTWSLVPNVVLQLSHYLERSLCALASAMGPDADANTAFDDAYSRLVGELESILAAGPNPVVAEALTFLQSSEGRNVLRLEFLATYFVVRLARDFLFDDTLHARVIRDSSTVVRDGERTYDLAPGEYPDEPIESPVGFLLDRFRASPEQANDDVLEFQSVWQALLLIEAGAVT